MTYIKILRLTHQLFCSLPILFGLLDFGLISQITSAILAYAIGHLLASTAAFALNDYVDSFDTDKFSPENRSTKGKSLNKNMVATIVIGLSVVALGLFAYAGPLALIIGLATMLVMHAYSLPPLRLKRFIYVDVLVQFFAWLVIPYFAPYVLTFASLPTNPLSYLPFLYFTLFIVAASALGFILDIGADQKAGIFNTTAAWGYRKSLQFGSRTLLAALCVGLVLIYFHLSPWYYLTLPPGFKAYRSYGIAQANLDRPKEMEKYLLHVKSQGKLWGFILVSSVVIFLILQWQFKIF